MENSLPASKTLSRATGLTSVARIDIAKPFYFGFAALVLTLLTTAHPQNGESLFGAISIIGAAWLPAFIWVRRKMTGLPIFPLFALTHTWTFGLPLLYEHPIVSRFDPSNQLFGALSVMGFLLLSTAVWMSVRNARLRIPDYCFSVRAGHADWIFFSLLSVSIVFTMAVNGAWFELSPGTYSIVRSLILALQALGCFVMSFRLGSGDLTGARRLIFLILLVCLVIVSLLSLVMVSSMAIVALSSFGYVAGSGKMPWAAFVTAIAMFAFLQNGKSAMRDGRWAEGEQERVQPWEYPEFFAEWISTSVAQFSAVQEGDEEKSSLIERASLMQLLLYEQNLSSSVPFLYGETYAIVPQLLIPRILYPGRPTTHEGTYRLSVHYGFQTREETESTTIGFGLLNEAYANFGLIGMGLLALVLGFLYGEMERLSASVPLLSFKCLFAIIIASYCFQTEFAAGVYAAAVSQSTIALILLSFLIMARNPNPLSSIRARSAERTLCEVPSR